jgi:outer membrane protein OmpA-like peptidoglycan-associated protein
MFKKPRYDKLTADGSQMVERVAGMLKKYPEYRARIKVHGFGSPVKYEDATGTDRMARLIRSALADKAKMDLVSIEAVGAGVTEPVYPKSNVEGNRRVEITFIKK